MIRAYYLAFFFIGFAAAQQCPNITGKPDFNIARFDGKWYEIQRYANEFAGKCVTVTFSVDGNGSIHVQRKEVSSRTNLPLSFEGYVILDANDKAKLSVEVPSTVDVTRIVDTDYDSFAVVWQCQNGIQNAWLRTRTKQPADSILEKAHAVFDKNGISRDPLQYTDQQNCPKESEGEVCCLSVKREMK